MKNKNRNSFSVYQERKGKFTKPLKVTVTDEDGTNSFDANSFIASINLPESVDGEVISQQVLVQGSLNFATVMAHYQAITQAVATVLVKQDMDTEDILEAMGKASAKGIRRAILDEEKEPNPLEMLSMLSDMAKLLGKMQKGEGGIDLESLIRQMKKSN